MKLLLVFLILLCSLSSLRAQQYHTNTYCDTNIVGDYLDKADCTLPLVSGSIALDTSLYTYVTGLRFVVVFDSITDVVNNPAAGQIYTGDTFQLNATHASVSYILSGNNATCSYHVQLIGTPSALNQTYPCKLQFDVCTCYCPRNIIIAADTTAGICHVDAGSVISELSYNSQVNIYPNPAAKQLYLSTGGATAEAVHIYSTTGQLMLEGKQPFSNAIDISGLVTGVYLLEIKTKEESVRRMWIKM